MIILGHRLSQPVGVTNMATMFLTSQPITNKNRHCSFTILNEKVLRNLINKLQI